jgi:hypothetical protein
MTVEAAPDRRARSSLWLRIALCLTALSSGLLLVFALAEKFATPLTLADAIVEGVNAPDPVAARQTVSTIIRQREARSGTVLMTLAAVAFTSACTGIVFSFSHVPAANDKEH